MKTNWSAYVFAILLLANPLRASQEAAAWPAGQVDRSELPAARATEYEFSDVEVGTIAGWLKWLGVELPVNVRGQLAGWLWAQRSSQGWLSFRDYRIEGEISSKQLAVESWLVDNASVRFGYSGGTWYVGDLAGVIRQKDLEQPIGRVRAAASLATTEKQLVSIKGKIGQVDLSQLLKAFDISVDLGRGSGDLIFEGDVPLSKFTDLSGWNARAALEVSGVRIGGLPQVALSAQADLADGQWLMRAGSIGIGQQTIPFNGSGRVDADLPFQVAVEPTTLSLPALVGDLEFLSLARDLTGEAEFSADILGTALAGLKQANAKIAAAKLDVGPLPLESVELTARFKTSETELEGRYCIELASLRVAGGWLNGQAGWIGSKSLSYGLPSSAELSMRDVDLRFIGGLFELPSMAGIASGRLRLETQQANHILRWSSASTLDCNGFNVADVGLGDAHFTLSKTFESDTVRAELSSSDGSINAGLGIQFATAPSSRILHTQFSSYSVQGEAEEFGSSIALNSRSDFKVPFVVSGDFEFQGEPSSLLNRGEARLEKLHLQLGQEALQLDTAHLLVSPSEFLLASFRIRDSNGRVAGAGRFSRDGSGQHLLNLRIAQVQVEPYMRLLPVRELRGVRGLASLEMKLLKSGVSRSLRQGWQGDFSGDLQDISYRTLPIGQLQLAGGIADETIRVDLGGSLAGGEISVRGELPIAMLREEENESELTPLELNANLTGLDLSRLHRLMGGNQNGPRTSGLASFKIRGSGHKAEDFALQTELTVPMLKYDRMELLKDFRVLAGYESEILEVKSVRGGLAGGRIQAAGRLRFDSADLSRPPTGSLKFDASQLRVGELVGLFLPEFADRFSGIAGYRGQIRVGPAISISGSAHASQSSAFGLPLQHVRGTLRLSLGSDGSLQRLASTDLHGMAVGGRFEGSVVLRGVAGYALDAKGRIGDGRLDQLSEGLGFSHIVGTGRFDSQVELRSKRLTSLGALSGALSFRFGESDAQSMPLVSDIGTYAPLLSLASTDITGGTLHAKIGGGQLRIQDLFLNSNAFWLVADGQVGLADSRLDLNALLQTGGGLEQQLANSGVSAAAVALLPQAAAVAQISDLVSNRSLYFHIGGTANKPVIQARLAQTAARALVESVRRQLLIAPSAVPPTVD